MKKIKILFLGTVILFLAAIEAMPKVEASNISPDSNELKKIKEVIREKGAKWQAGETSISKLTFEERKMRANAKEMDMSNVSPAPAVGNIALQASFDWDSNNGDFVTPVRDQGNCGSCWAFADTAALESYSLRAMNMPGTNLDLSEQILISCDGGAGSCSGGYTSKAADYLISTGLPKESYYFYTATNGRCSSALPGWKNYTYKIGNWGSVNRTVSDIKNALVTYGPLVTTFYVYDDFDYYTGGVYSYTYGNLLGGHAVTLVGYDDASQSFIVKNSWGAGWGEGGFFRIAYSEVGGKTNFGGQTLAYYTTAPAPRGGKK